MIPWLEREVGFDLFYGGAAQPEVGEGPSTSGVDASYVERCERVVDRYAADRRALHRAALARGGVAVDVESLSAHEREQMPLYTEVMRGLGVRVVVVAVLSVGRRATGCIYLGRAGRGAKAPRSLDLLRAALPILSLGDAVHGGRVEAASADRSTVTSVGPVRDRLSASGRRVDQRRLSAREQEVLHLVSRGLTNREIAGILGTSRATVKNQVSSIIAKADVSNRTELTALARSIAWLWRDVY